MRQTRVDEADEKEVVAPLRLLELFSGTGSIGRAFEAQGWEVISVDLDPEAQATFRQDITRWDCAALLGKKIDVIWASPPCTNYSILRKSTEDDRVDSDELVRKTLQIIEDLGNPPCFIENPWTGKLKRRGIMDHLKLQKVDYCTYGMPYRKRTAIWTNTTWIPSRPLCKHDCASSRNGRTHIATAQRGPPGPRFTQRELYRIPAELCEEIAQCMNVGICESVCCPRATPHVQHTPAPS